MEPTSVFPLSGGASPSRLEPCAKADPKAGDMSAYSERGLKTELRGSDASLSCLYFASL